MAEVLLFIQQRLYFLPLPQGQGSFRPDFMFYLLVLFTLMLRHLKPTSSQAKSAAFSCLRSASVFSIANTVVLLISCCSAKCVNWLMESTTS